MKKLGTNNDKVRLQIPQNLFGPSAQIGQFTLNCTTHSSVLLLCVVRFNVNKTLFGIFLGKNLHQMSIVHVRLEFCRNFPART